MKIELRSIKYAAFASEETHCHQSKLYVDGKHVADISNDGHGGADYVYWKNGAHVSEKQVNEWIKANDGPSIIKCGGKDMTIEHNLEIFCGNAINDFLTEREVSRALRDMKRKVLTLSKDEKLQVYSWKGVKQIGDRHIESIRKEFPDRIILNCLAADEARKLVKQAIAA